MNLIQAGGSWSGHERNCCFLNTGQTRFANVSAVSGLDFLDDGRCLAPVDWDHDGDLDLWLSARTGPTLRFVRNNGTDGHHFVAFRLQGTTCNRDAIGARIEVHCGDEILIRTLHAGDGYLSQAGKWIHFGLGTKQAIDSVIVRWPSGDVQQFSGAVVDQHFRIVQGQNAVQVWTPPERTVALATSRLDTVKAERAQRVVLRDRVPMANLQYQTFDGTTAEIPGLSDGPVLVNLGNAFRQLNRRKLAADHLVRAVQLKPELLQAHMTLGLLYLDENKLQAAAQHFQATVQIQPEFSDGCHYLGLALLRMGYRQQGVSQLRKAVLIDSDNAAAKKDLNLAVMGQVP